VIVLALGCTLLLLIGYGIYYWHQNAVRGVKAPLKKALLQALRQLFLTAPGEVLLIVIILLLVLAALIK